MQDSEMEPVTPSVDETHWTIEELREMRDEGEPVALARSARAPIEMGEGEPSTIDNVSFVSSGIELRAS